MTFARFLRHFRNELIKLLARKRTYLGFIIFFATELLITWLWQKPFFTKAIQRLMINNGLELAEYSGGLSLASFILVLTIALAAGLYLSLIAGDLIAKEIEDGTIRMVLARPISRGWWFAIKALVGATYTFLLLLFVGLSSLAVGVIGQGGLGNLLFFAPLEKVFSTFEPTEGLWRYFAAIIVMAFAYQAVSALALMCSSMKLRPATATVTTLSVLYLDFAFNSIPFFSTYKVWFLSHHLSCWALVFRDVLPWHSIAVSLLVLFTLTVSFWTIGVSCLCARDIKN